MNTKNKANITAAIGVACVWMGTHFGPGLGSGTQINTYFVKFGLPGIIVSVLAMALLGYGLYCSTEFSRIYQTYDYGSWMQKLFGVKWVSVLFDISFVITCVTALGGSLNAIATLLNNEFGVNYWLGVILVVICAALLCAFGAKIVAAASSYMMYAVIAVMVMIVILVVMSGQADLAGSIANQATNENLTVSWPQAIWSAIVYAAFQCTVIANISSVANTVPNRATSKRAAIFGIIGNSFMLVLMGTLLFSYTNVTNITNEALPFYSILEGLGYGWAKLVYVLIVFVAVLSTAVGFCFGGLARFSKFYRKPEEKTPVKDGVLVAGILVLCSLCSVFGIVALVSTGYTILGYINLPLLLIPAIFVGGRKISKKFLKEHNIDAPGID